VIDEINVEKLKNMLDQKENFNLIDVRELAEYERGHIEGSIHIPLSMIPLKLNEFEKNSTYVLQCRSGARSYQAASFLEKNGFENVSNLSGGIIAWAEKIDQSVSV
jgi:rhodanese-related sulfurtransferase